MVIIYAQPKHIVVDKVPEYIVITAARLYFRLLT